MKKQNNSCTAIWACIWKSGVCDQQAFCYAELSLDVDADRDGIVEKNNPKKVI